MDQGTVGRVGGKVDETSTSSKVPSKSSTNEHAEGRPAASSDTVSLTSSAKLLERLDKTLAALPAINTDRVAEIKTAIENGNYEIDAEAIADAMIRLDRSLGN